MFIRKRVSHTKGYGVTEHYQVLYAYREGSAVRQRVVCNLKRDSTPAMALKTARDELLRAEKWHARCASDDLMMIGRRRYYDHHKEPLRREAAARLDRCRKRVALLEDVVLQWLIQYDKADTTNVVSQLSS